MGNQAVGFAPLGLTARAFIVVTELWPHDALIALSKVLEAGKAEALVEALFDLPIAVDAADLFFEFYSEMLSELRVHG